MLTHLLSFHGAACHPTTMIHCPVSTALIQRDKKRPRAMSVVVPTLPRCTTLPYDRQWTACGSQGIQPTMRTPHFQQATTLVESVASLPLAQEKLKLLPRVLCNTGKMSLVFGRKVPVRTKGMAMLCTRKRSQEVPRSKHVISCPFLCLYHQCSIWSFLLHFVRLGSYTGQQQMAAVVCKWSKWLRDPYFLPVLEGRGKGRSSGTSEQQYCLIWNPSPGSGTQEAFLCYHGTISSRWHTEKLRLRTDPC